LAYIYERWEKSGYSAIGLNLFSLVPMAALKEAALTKRFRDVLRAGGLLKNGICHKGTKSQGRTKPVIPNCLNLCAASCLCGFFSTR